MNDKPFIPTRLEEERAKDKSKVFTVRLNADEIKMLEEVKEFIEQPKDSTALKSMFYFAYFDVIHDKKLKYIINTLFKNKRNNKRLGIVDFD